MRKSFEFYHKGIEKYNSGDYKEAISAFDREIDRYSLYPGTHIYRGYARYRLGDKDGALMDWLKAAELGDGNVYDIIEKYFG